MPRRDQFVQYVNEYLNIESCKDYAPNGLQVQGREEIGKVVLGVSASLELIEKAISIGADTIMVHHGWFWRGEPAPIVGMKYRRLARLMRHQINLCAYHLPLDMHPEVGNNAILGKIFDIQVEKVLEGGLFYIGSLSHAVPACDFAQKVHDSLARPPLLLGSKRKLVQRIAWCSGAAQDYLALAKKEGADLYLSGEVSERTYYEAVEQDMVYLAAGHAATERYGIQALGRHLHQIFPRVEFVFIGDENPV